MNDLFSPHLEDRELAARFDADAWIRTCVDVEVALARAQAAAGAIPAAAAGAIAARARDFSPDLAELASGVARDGFPILALVEQLRAGVGPDAAAFVHWGATTQDIVDTALVLELRNVLERCERELTGICDELVRLANSHRSTVMIGRTHLQPAVPITFGLKAASWLAPLLRHRGRLAELRRRVLVVQLGGAAGTLASLGDRADAIARHFAAELKLGLPAMPWHAQRDSILETSGWLALATTSVAKIAQDVLLLAQPEIGEVRESADAARGGSSAMPQKANPVRCEAILVSARLAATHHGALLSAPPPEHERGTQTGQLELVHLPRVCALAGGALRATRQLLQELVVDAARMRANLDATHGTLLAEVVANTLARHLARGEARAVVRAAARRAQDERRHLLAIVRELPAAQPALGGLPADEAEYLGASGAFIDRVLAEHAALFTP